METRVQNQDRSNWIDWMKVLGMLLIIIGHLTPPGYKYVYVFSVPLFFIISGYLTKIEEVSSVFWNKTWRRLLLPTLILWCITMVLRNVFVVIKGQFTCEMFVTNCLSGIWGGQESLETLWFVYTLFITKLALQYFRRNLDLIMINVICILICILLLKFGISGRNAILNAAPAFPFVSFGFFLRKYRGMLNRKYKLPVLLLVCIVMIVVTSLVYFLNGAPWMFRNDYGNDFSAFFIGGVSGTALIYCIAKFFENKTSNTLVLLSNGTLVILAIHPQFLRLIGTCGFELGLSKYVLAIVILVLFVPILSFCKRYLPILAR